MIYGKFQIGNMDYINHITRSGLKHMLSRDLMADQPNLPRTNSYTAIRGSINTLFALIRPSGQTEHRFTEDQIFDLTWAEVNAVAPGTLYVSTYPKINFVFPNNQDFVIEALGVGYKEVGGDGSNDFIFSFTNIIPYTVAKGTGINENDTWHNTFSWELNYVNEPLPSIIVNIGGTDYKFNESRLVGMGGKLFGDSTDVAFSWEVNNFIGANASLFDELTINDPNALARAFKVEYYNPRSYSVNITGFNLKIANTTWQYRLDSSQTLTILGGKTLSIVLQLEIEGGYLPPLRTDIVDTLANSKITYGGRDQIAAAIVTTRPGLAGSQTTRVTGDVLGPENSQHEYYNDEFYKIVYEHISGHLYDPIYVVGSKIPTTYSFNQPTLSASNGWTVDANHDVKFRITVPGSVTELQLSIGDNVWTTYPVTSGQVNELVLDKKFLNPLELYARWGNGASTGLIATWSGFGSTLYSNDTPILVEPAFDNREATLVELKNYYVGKPTKATYLNVPFTALNSYTGPGTGTPYHVSPIYAVDTPVQYMYCGSGLLNAPHYGIPSTPKFLDINLMKMVDTPEYVGVVTSAVFRDPSSSFYTNRRKWATRTAEVHTYNHLAYPRGIKLTLSFNPSSTPHLIEGVLTSKTNKVQLYIVETGEILQTLTLTEGTRWSINISDRLFNHLNYGIRYLNAANQNLSLGVEYVFKGNSLAPPDTLTSVNYDAPTKTLSFATPARGTRAIIKRFNTEIYSFETMPGTTYLVTTTELVPTGRYELWVFNANNETWDEPFLIFGDQDDNAIKPPEVGPYLFPEWSRTDKLIGWDYYTPDPRLFDQGFPYKVRFNNQTTDAVIIEHIKNSADMTMSVTWASGLGRLKWTTGLTEESTLYTHVYSGTPKIVLEYPQDTNLTQSIYFYHDWLLIGVDVDNDSSFVKWSSMTNTYQPTTGNVEDGVRQKTDNQTGYMRNTLALNWTVYNESVSCPLWHLDPTITGYRKDIPIYLFMKDIIDSYTNEWITVASKLTPLINGKVGTWEFTRDSNNLITFMRCTNVDGVSFHWDCLNKSAGWIWDQYNPVYVGDPEYIDTTLTLEFCFPRNQFYTMQLSSFFSSPSPGVPATNYRHWIGKFNEAIFARIKPYAANPTLEVIDPNWATYSNPEQNTFKTNASRFYQAEEMFNQAMFTVNIADGINTHLDSLATNTLVAINGETGVISREVVTKDVPLYPTIFANGQPINWLSQEFTDELLITQISSWNAIKFDTDDFTVQNLNHPYLFEIIRKTSVAGKVRVVVAKRDPGVMMSVMSDAINTLMTTRTIDSQVFYFFVMEFFDTANTYANPDMWSPTTRDAPAAFPVTPTLPMAFLQPWFDSFAWDDVNDVYIDNVDVNISAWFKIDGNPLLFTKHPTLKPSIYDGYDGIPFERVPVYRLTDSTDPAVYLEIYSDQSVDYVGFAVGDHVLEFEPVDYTSFSNALLYADTTLMKTYTPAELGEYGIVYNELKNWIVTDINTRLGTYAIYLAAGFNIPDPTTDPEFDPSTLGGDFQAIYDREEPMMTVNMPFGLNPNALVDETEYSSALVVRCNDLIADNVEYIPNPDYITDLTGGMDPAPTVIDTSDKYWGDLVYTFISLEIKLKIKVAPGEKSARLTDLDDNDIFSIDETKSYRFHIYPANPVSVNGVSPLCVNDLYYPNIFVAGLTWWKSTHFTLNTYNNGNQLWPVLDLALGNRPMEIPNYNLGPTPFTAQTQLGVEGRGLFSNDQMVPNIFMYPKELFTVTVNGHPAEIISAPATTEPQMASDYYSLHPMNQFASLTIPWSWRSRLDFLPIVDIESNGDINPIPDLTGHYDASAEGIPSAMTFDLDPNKPKYIYTLTGAMLSGKDDTNGNVDGDLPANAMLVQCTALDLILYYDPNSYQWRVYHGQVGIVYRMEFRYLDLLPINIGLDPVKPTPFLKDPGWQSIHTLLDSLDTPAVCLMPNIDFPDRIEVSAMVTIKPNTDRDLSPGGGLDFRFKGEVLPHFPNLKDELLTYPYVADPSFVWLPLDLGSELVLRDHVFRINGNAAIPDFTNLTFTTPPRVGYYVVSEVAENNDYPTIDVGDSFTITDGTHVVKYDVATATWRVIGGPDSNGVVVECLTFVEQPDITDGSTLGMFGNNIRFGKIDDGTYFGFVLNNFRGEPDLTFDTTLNDFKNGWLDGFIPFIENSIAIPNYELFDIADYRFSVDGTVITGTPFLGVNDALERMEYDIPTYGCKLVVDIVNRIGYYEDTEPTEFTPILGYDRTNYLTRNEFTTILNRRIDFVAQWDYMNLLDINDTRPVFLDGDSTGDIYFWANIYSNFFTEIAGTKKRISVATPRLVSAIDGISEPIIDTFGTQLLYGWEPANYIGPTFAANFRRIAVNGLASTFFDSTRSYAEIMIDYWLDENGGVGPDM